MKFNIPQEIRDLITFAKQALQDLQLQETAALTAQEIDNFKLDYPPPLSLSWRTIKYNPKNLEEYRIFASKILDYFVVQIPEMIFQTIDRFENSASYLSILSAVNSDLESKGANSLARYLGKSRVPDFVDDAKLYQKMLWLEWLLHHTTHLINKGIIVDFSVPVLGGPAYQIQMRLTATQEFLKKYCEKHTDCLDQLTSFRSSYTTKDMKESFQIAMQAVMLPKINGAFNTTASHIVNDSKREHHLPNSANSDDEFHDATNQQMEIKPIAANSTQLELTSLNTETFEEPDEAFHDALEYPGEDENAAHLRKLKHTILTCIQNWAQISVNLKETPVYNIKYDQERAKNLIADITIATDVQSLKKLVANFIATGQTKRDITLFTFSRIDVQDSLRQYLASDFCKAVLTESKNLFFGRKMLPLSADSILPLLKINTVHTTSLISKK